MVEAGAIGLSAVFCEQNTLPARGIDQQRIGRRGLESGGGAGGEREGEAEKDTHGVTNNPHAAPHQAARLSESAANA